MKKTKHEFDAKKFCRFAEDCTHQIKHSATYCLVDTLEDLIWQCKDLGKMDSDLNDALKLATFVKRHYVIKVED